MQPKRNNTDGRIARGERTREAIVAAHTEMLREGVLRPTGQMLADRAGVSLRTIWLNFKDIEGLLTATTAYWLDSDAQLRRQVDPSLPLAERIVLYCCQRRDRLEQMAPAARSAALGEPFSAALQVSRRRHVDRSMKDLAETFAPELAAIGPGQDVLLKALFVATSWAAWSTLRDDHGDDADAALDAMRFSLTKLLTP